MSGSHVLYVHVRALSAARAGTATGASAGTLFT